MARSKRPDPSVIGATLPGDLAPEALEDIEVSELSAQFELEGVRLASSA